MKGSESMQSVSMYIASVTCGLLAAGCAATQQRPIEPEERELTPGMETETPVTDARAEGSEATPALAPQAVREGERIRYVLPYPTGERETSVILVEKIVPASVRVGQPYEYTVQVTNLTDAPVAGVRVTETLRGIDIQSVQLLQPEDGEEAGMPAGEGQSEESPKSEPGQWVFGTLAPRATQSLVVQAAARQTGQLDSCLVTEYEPTLCTAVNVVNPELQITKLGPERAYICEELAYRYRVTNTGSGVAENVVITEALPDGLTTERGETEIRIEVGDLPESQSEEVQVTLAPNAVGGYESRATATSETDEVVSEPIATAIVQPTLQVDVMGPEWQYANQPVTYTVEVSNTSNVPAPETVLELEAENVGKDLEPKRLGTIAPGETKRVSFTLEAEEQPIQVGAAATSVCAARAADMLTTTIRTLPALLLETVDRVDPVEVGQNTVYAVTVRNQGNAAADQVQIRAELPPNMSFVGADGATPVQQQEEGAITLGTIESLPPGETATWEIEVRAEEPGTARFRTELESEFLEAAVPDVEPTRVIQPR